MKKLFFIYFINLMLSLAMMQTILASDTSTKDTKKRKFSKHQNITYIKKLGEGTGGVVWLANINENKQQVVIKISKKDHRGIKQTKLNYKGEVSMLTIVNYHPNIIKMLDSFISNAGHCIMFEAMACDLCTKIYNNNRQGFSLEFTKGVTSSLLRALSYLASLGIIHGDVKPENILVDDKGFIKLADFGLSEIGENKNLIQSLIYRAPEVLLNNTHSSQADIWSAAIVAVELFSGEVLFDAEGEKDLLDKIISVLGNPNIDMIRRSKYYDYEVVQLTKVFVDDSNRISNLVSILRSRSLYDKTQRECYVFVTNILNMLVVDPTDRFSADFLIGSGCWRM